MELTIILHTTFGRFKEVKKTIESIPSRYRVLISDTGELTQEKLDYYKGKEWHYMGWDTTPATCRNFLMEKVETEFVLKLDDDFIFTPTEEEISGMIEGMKKFDDLGFLGFQVRSKKNKSKYFFDIEKTDKIIQTPAVGYYCDAIPDIWIAKRACFPDCNWDERYHVGEGLHLDFFLNIKYNTQWQVAYSDVEMYTFKFDKGFEVDRSGFYWKKRMRNYPNLDKLKQKWKVKEVNIW